MFGLFTLGQTLLKIFAGGDKSGVEITEEERKARAQRVLDEFNLGMHKGSISKLINSYVIQPTVYVSKDLKGNEDALNAINTNLDVFASFLVMAFKRLVEIEGVDVRTALTLLNTTSGTSKVLDQVIIAGLYVADKNNVVKLPIKQESWSGQHVELGDYGVNNIKNILRGNNEEIKVTYGDIISQLRREENEDPEIVKLKTRVATTSKNSGVDFDKSQAGYEYMLRSFEFQATITTKAYGSAEAKEYDNIVITCPIQVKANIVYIDEVDLQAALVDKTKESSFIRRWERWRAGGISFKEFLFASDLINEYRAAKVKDSKNMIGKMKELDLDSIAKFVATNKTFGYSRYYNMFVLTEHDTSVASSVLGGKNIGDNNSAKEMFLEKLNGLMVTVVDQKWEMVNLGIKDMNGFSTASFKDLKKKKSKKDGGINDDILKLLLGNRMPTF